MAINTRQLRMIAALSLPAVITNITTPILALTDVAIVGHMGSAIFIAAIAVGGTMFNTMFWLFGFLRMGSSGLTAQAYGAGDRRGAQTVLARSLLLALLIGIAMIAAREPVCSLLFDLLDVDGSTASVARSYFMIVVWSAPAVLGLYSLTGWFVGMQDSRTPMWVSLFVDVFNIGASLMFVFLIRMKIEGVATGTLVAQWAGFLLALFLAVRKYGWHKVGFRNLIDGLPRFFRINSDIFLRTVCLVAVTLWFTRTGAMQGPVMLAVNALLMQLFTLYSFFMDGLAFASEALCGRYLGAGDRPMLSLSVRSLMGVGIILALVFTAVYVGCAAEFRSSGCGACPSLFSLGHDGAVGGLWRIPVGRSVHRPYAYAYDAHKHGDGYAYILCVILPFVPNVGQSWPMDRLFGLSADARRGSHNCRTRIFAICLINGCRHRIPQGRHGMPRRAHRTTLDRTAQSKVHA